MNRCKPVTTDGIRKSELFMSPFYTKITKPVSVAVEIKWNEIDMELHPCHKEEDCLNGLLKELWDYSNSDGQYEVFFVFCWFGFKIIYELEGSRTRKEVAEFYMLQWGY